MGKTKSSLEQRSMRYLLTSLLALVALQHPLSAGDIPRVVVYLTIEDQRGDYLQQLSPLFSKDGLGRMLQEGKVYPQVRFPLAELDRASATATLHTGAYPQIHGVERSTLWDTKQHSWRPIFHDPSVIGSYTRDTYSPKALLVNTLGDRIKEASSGAGLVYAVASDGSLTEHSGSTPRSPRGRAPATMRRCLRVSRRTTALPMGRISAS